MRKYGVFGILCMALAICAVLLFTGTTEASAATVASGTCGADLTWRLDDTGTLTISGTGNMYYYSSSYNYGWNNYRNSVRNVIIQQGVSNIGDYAFEYFQNLTGITIPNSVTSIGAYSFRDCAQLNAVTIPSGVHTIGKRAFEQSGLTSIVIPDSVTTLEEAAFIYCSKLTSAELGNGIAVIPTDAFYYCTKLKSVNIPYGVTRIEKSAFSWCALTSLSIPNSVTFLGKYSFNANNYLTSVTIPDSVQSIDAFAFSSCKLLTGIWVSANNTNYSSDTHGVLFDKNKEALICAPSGMTGSYEIPDSVVNISENAFYECSGLTNIVIPDSVRSVGDCAFYDCTKLTATTYDNAKYIGNSSNPYMLLLEATSTAIASCTIHPQTRFVESYAFSRCSALKTIIMQDEVISISSYAFSGCSVLESVIYCGTETQWNEIIMGDNSYLTNAVRTYHGIIVSEATCTIPALCSICGDVVIASLGHSGQWFELVEETCTAEGVNARICETCGETETQYIPATGHSYSEVVTAPTCTEQGYTTKDCATCGDHVVTDFVAANGHSYTETTTQPTCTEDGSQVNICSVCGDQVTETIPARGHSWSDWITTVKAACTTEGSQMRFCNCGTRETEAIAKLPHSYVDGVCSTCSTAMSGYVVLTADMNLTGLGLTEDLYIDLNGCDLSGTVNTNGYMIYGMDSTTDSYTCEGIGYMNLVDESGNAVAPVPHFKSDITGSTKRYMAIKDDNGYSFHRFYLGITHQSLKPTTIGVGYKAVFYGDAMVAANLDSFGFTMTLGNYTPRTFTKTADSFVSGKVYTLRIDNYDVENYGEIDLYASVMLKLADGTVIESTTCAMTMRGLLEQLNDNYTALTADQLTAVADMIKKYTTIQSWKVENLYTA